MDKAAAMKKARKLPGPPPPGVIMTIKPVEVALAWIELHGLDSAKTPRGNPRWHADVLVLKNPTPDPFPSLRDGEGGLE